MPEQSAEETNAPAAFYWTTAACIRLCIQGKCANASAWPQ